MTGFPAGTHRYRVAVKLFAFDAMLQLNPSGGASGEGMVALEEGAVLAVRWRSGEPPAVVGSSPPPYTDVASGPVFRQFRRLPAPVRA